MEDDKPSLNYFFIQKFIPNILIREKVDFLEKVMPDIQNVAAFVVQIAWKGFCEKVNIEYSQLGCSISESEGNKKEKINVIIFPPEFAQKWTDSFAIAFVSVKKGEGLRYFTLERPMMLGVGQQYKGIVCEVILGKKGASHRNYGSTEDDMIKDFIEKIKEVL
jgi:hypothetical protein